MSRFAVPPAPATRPNRICPRPATRPRRPSRAGSATPVTSHPMSPEAVGFAQPSEARLTAPCRDRAVSLAPALNELSLLRAQDRGLATTHCPLPHPTPRPPHYPP